MLFSYQTPIWLYPAPVDFRKQIDGLSILVADQLDLDPLSGQLFIFRNRQGNKVKLLWYDQTGFWLCYKRLEKGRFQFPEREAAAMELTRDQLSWLLSGLDFLKQGSLPVTKARYIF